MTDYEKEQFWSALQRLYDTSLETTKQVQALLATSTQDGEKIRALVRIAELHDRRITGLEGPVSG
ncbi:MAG: hypothetical protein ACR2NN_15150 [Bryobacteraceae bacterium]